MATQSALVVGIDVGGRKKGFHGVALRGREVTGKFTSADPKQMADWARGLGALVVGVDAPCRWSATGRQRLAENELARKKISCFSSPTRARAAANTSTFYEWMFQGEALFAELEKTYRLFDGSAGALKVPTCFETFPQAVACELAGKIVSAKKKTTERRELLVKAGIDITPLTNIDLVDAALCALTAEDFLAGRIKAYGDAAEGFIVVPE
jgi:predicted nuclease with RNAse H fold